MNPVVRLYWQPLPPVDPGARCLWRPVADIPVPEGPDWEAVWAQMEAIFRERMAERPDGYGPLVEHVEPSVLAGV